MQTLLINVDRQGLLNTSYAFSNNALLDLEGGAGGGGGGGGGKGGSLAWPASFLLGKSLVKCNRAICSADSAFNAVR